VQSLQPQKATACTKTRHTTYIPSTRFCSAHPFTQPPKIPCFTMLFNRLYSPKSAISHGASTAHVIRVPWTHPTQHSKMYIDRFSRFRAAHGRESLYFTMCDKTRLTLDKRINRFAAVHTTHAVLFSYVAGTDCFNLAFTIRRKGAFSSCDLELRL